MKRKTKGRIREFERAGMQKTSGQYRQERQQVQQAMREEETVRARKKVKFNKSRMIMTVIVIILIAVVGMSVKTVFDLRSEQKDLKDMNKGLLSEKASLIEELENVNDKDYIEEQARIQLKLIKPGEILYILENQRAKDNDKDKAKD